MKMNGRTDPTELSLNPHTRVVAHALYPIALTHIINRKKLKKNTDLQQV